MSKPMVFDVTKESQQIKNSLWDCTIHIPKFRWKTPAEYQHVKLSNEFQRLVDSINSEKAFSTSIPASKENPYIGIRAACEGDRRPPNILRVFNVHIITPEAVSEAMKLYRAVIKEKEFDVELLSTSLVEYKATRSGIGFWEHCTSMTVATRFDPSVLAHHMIRKSESILGNQEAKGVWSA